MFRWLYKPKPKPVEDDEFVMIDHANPYTLLDTKDEPVPEIIVPIIEPIADIGPVNEFALNLPDQERPPPPMDGLDETFLYIMNCIMYINEKIERWVSQLCR